MEGNISNINGAKIVIVEDDRSYAQALARALATRFTCYATDTIAGAKETILSAVDIGGMLVDVWLPDGSGLELCEEVRRERPFLPIVVMTAFGSPEVSLAALRIRAPLLLKPFDNCELEAVVDFFAIGCGLFYAEDAGASVLDGIDAFRLTRRQKEVLTLALSGFDHRGMREQLGISENTLKTHIKAILRRHRERKMADLVRNVRCGIF